MNNLQDLIKRLSAIGQVNEAEEKCSECGCTPCECDDKEKVEEGKKPDFLDADKDGDKKEPMSDALKDKEEEKVDEGKEEFFRERRRMMEMAGIEVTDEMLEEDWKSKLAAAGTAAAIGATSLGMMGGLPGQSSADSSVTRPTEFSQQIQAGQQLHAKAEALAKVNKQFAKEYQDGYLKIQDDPRFKDYPKLANLETIKFTQQLLAKYQANEGAMDSLKALGKKALDTLGHKDDEELIKDMQRQQGQEPTGKKPEPVKENATLAILRQLAGIKEAKIEEDDVEEGNEFSGALKAAKDAGKDEFEVAGKKYKVNECGDYPESGQMSPMTMTGQEQPHMGIPAEVMAQIAGQEQGPEMAQPEMAAPEAPMYTLTVRNGENNLTMTTDVPDEIMHVMKLAGVNKGAEVTKKETPAGGEQEVEESGYENTPDNTKARDPQAFGDIRDWGQKGTAKASTHYTPAQSGDNPMNEQRMFEDYKNFKAGK